MNDRTLDAIENEAYRATYSDGLIDVFVGLSLLWIGAAWIWLPDLAGVAGVLPAVFVTPALAGRKRLVEEHAGYVKWSPARQRWQSRNLVLAVASGTVLLAAGIGTFFAVQDGSRLIVSIGPAILAWLLGLIALGLAYLMTAWRMVIYAAVLVIAGALAAVSEANPGWPLVAAGAAVLAVGAAMARRFLDSNPVEDGHA